MSQELLSVDLNVEKGDVRELVNRIMRGEWCIYLPQFQRIFEWDSEDVRYFFDSIIRNLPVGSIILWEPAGRIEEDPFATPLIDIEKRIAYRKSYYLLDGQQRLTALLLLYNGWKIIRGGEEVKLDDVISYVPAQNKLIRGSRGGVDISQLFKAYIDGRIDSATKDYPSYKNELEEVARRIVEYRIPYYIITTLSESDKVLAEMADAFIRINKAGIRIGTIELMLSFLAGTVSGEFRSEMRSLYKKFEKYDIDLNILIRFVLSNFGVKQTVFSNVDQFKSSVKNVKFREDILLRSEKAIELTMDFLYTELGLSSCKIIPSRVSLVPVATYFYEKNVHSMSDLSEAERRNIASWFIIVNMKGYYSSSTNTKLERDLEIIREKPTTFPYDNLKGNLGERCKLRKAEIEKGNDINVLKKQGLQHLFLLYVLLVKEKAEDLDGRLLSSKPYQEMHRHHIFPREILSSSEIAPDDPDEREVFISGLGNITFVSEQLHEEMVHDEPSEYLPNCKALWTHFIPYERDLWKLKNFEEFKRARIENIYRAAKKVFPEVVE